MTLGKEGALIIMQDALQKAKRMEDIKRDSNVKIKTFLKAEELSQVRGIMAFVIYDNVILHNATQELYKLNNPAVVIIANFLLEITNTQIVALRELLNIIAKVPLAKAKKEDLTFLQTVSTSDDLESRYPCDDIKASINAMFMKNATEIDLKKQDPIRGIFLHINYIFNNNDLEKYDNQKEVKVHNALKTFVKEKKDIAPLLHLLLCMYNDFEAKEEANNVKAKAVNLKNKDLVNDILKMI